MIPAPFDYVKPKSLDEARSALTGVGGGAAILAGGQSLINELKQRRRRPALVVDLGGIASLTGITADRKTFRIAAMVRQADVVANADIAANLPLLTAIAAVGSDPMVRQRGTLVGALCAVEPGGDWVAGALVLDAVMEIAGARATREMPLAAFVRGPRETALEPGEIATAVRLEVPPAGTRTAYRKVKHGAVGWSVASAAVSLALDEAGRVSYVRIAVSGAVTHPQRLEGLETDLARIDLRDAGAVARSVARNLEGLAFEGDYYASAGYRAGRLEHLLTTTVADLVRNRSALA